MRRGQRAENVQSPKGRQSRGVCLRVCVCVGEGVISRDGTAEDRRAWIMLRDSNSVVRAVGGTEEFKQGRNMATFSFKNIVSVAM